MKQLLCILFTFGLWVLLTWPPTVADLGAGIFVSFLVATLLAHIYPNEPQKALDPRRVFWMALYIPYFLYYCIGANFDVAYRVLNPDMPIRPGIVRVRTELKSDMAKMFLANSITLTPGTLTVDINGQDLYVHWINVQGEDPQAHTAMIVKRFERLLRRVFE